MKRVSQFSFLILLVMSPSLLAAEQPLESGYLKWMLHLGQNPIDRILSQYPPNRENLELWIGREFMPYPGQIYDFGDIWNFPTTNDMMIWTPQYSQNGFFAENIPEGQSTQFYHIYIFSPEQRQARLRFKARSFFRAWNGGQNLFDWKSSPPDGEGYEDFTLHKGVNSMTFIVVGTETHTDSYFAVRITDQNDNEYADLTFSLSPPLLSANTFSYRNLPKSYDAGGMIEVSLLLTIDPNDKPNSITIIEYIPPGLRVAEQGSGAIKGNTIQWSLLTDDGNEVNLNYSLEVPWDKTGPIAFCGYLYFDKHLQEIIGENILFEEEAALPSDMAGRIQTIEINPANYSAGDNVAISNLDDRSYYLVTGLRADHTGGWAEYEFTVIHSGRYQIILDYGEYWTMFHQYADVNVSIDNTVNLQTPLFPTTHSYPPSYNSFSVESYWMDPDRKAKWIVGSAELVPGVHSLRITFPLMYPADSDLDFWEDGRPVISRIIITNYPGFTVPNIADPHHLDSYEHAPAMLAHDRTIRILSEGCAEITFYNTLYSLSQGDEIYFVNGYVRPRVNQSNAKFEIISIEPEVFHISPNGEQELTLTVRSKEPVADDYSELLMVWIQSTPDAPSRKLYLFSTAQNYIDLPAYKPKEFPWDYKPLFNNVYSNSRWITQNIEDLAEMFIPSKDDLGFYKGRYNRGLIEFFKDQLLAGNLPSVQQIFQDYGWDSENQGYRSLDLIWSDILGTLYWMDNTEQAKAYIKQLSENMVFYPVETRWDWNYPTTLPNIMADVQGISVLATHVRTVQESLIDNNEQFKVLNNLVLPIFNSYYDALRVRATLREDVSSGDEHLPISRPSYGPTGSLSDGFNHHGYIMIGDDLSKMMWYDPTGDGLRMYKPLLKSYPKGTTVIPWNFYEDIELECTYLISLLAIGAASCDPAVIDEVIHIFSQILEKEKIFFADGSFRNEPGSYGHDAYLYPESLLKIEHLFSPQPLQAISPEVMDRMHKWMINSCEFPFSNGKVPHLNGGGCLNQLPRAYCGESGLIQLLENLFPEDRENIEFYQKVFEQEQNRMPGDIIDNINYCIDSWGYAMLRSENGSWDRGMETLLSSKHLLSDPGDHVSRDCLGIVIYGLGAILTPRYGYSWVGYLPSFLNQVMVDDYREDNHYYGSFWHFDGRKELPSAVAHTGDGIDCSESTFEQSRWCIQFPEYLFDAYFIEATDVNEHQYDWCFINMGELEIVEPMGLSWQDYTVFLDGYWPEPGTRGAEGRRIANEAIGRVVADWRVSNGEWEPFGDETLLRFTPQHGGRLRLIMANDGHCDLIDAQIGYYNQPDSFQANSQDILVIRKKAVSYAFVDTLEPIADDEEAYVMDVTVIATGNHSQQLVKVTTTEGEDWVYLSGKWSWRPDGDQPLSSITTDADIVAWRIINDVVRRVYLAGGSYANTPCGSWDFGYVGNHYVCEAD